MKLLLTITTLLTAFLFNLTSYADNTATTATTPAPATEVFSTEQKQAIEKIVHDYLVTNPTVLIEASQALQQKEAKDLKERAMKVIPTVSEQLFYDPISPVIGDKNAKVAVVEFFDYQCPHCKHMVEVIANTVKIYPNMQVIYKELPIFGDLSLFAAKAALAADKQGKYLIMHNALMATQGRFTSKDQIIEIASKNGINTTKLKKDMENTALTDEIKSNFNIAGKLNIMGTPAFIISQKPLRNTKVNNADLRASIIPGATNQKALAAAVAQAFGDNKNNPNAKNN